jgi:hypothetical protein
MTNQELARRQERAEAETLVIAEIDEGFTVYSPGEPKNIYRVTGTPESPQCTCPDFQFHAQDPAWRCKHILAVQHHFGAGNGTEPDPSSEAEERRAIQEESRPSRKRKATATSNTAANGAAQMVLKRSVSPDGRIDSLSVEFSCLVEAIPGEEIKTKATKILGLQSEIVASFLSPNGKAESQPRAVEEKSPAVPARLVNVAGMDTKWGRRLFVNVEVNGQTLKLFGKKTQLAEHLLAAGFAEVAQHVAEGLTLNLPCRVTTEPSADGKYTNVAKVLPAETPRQTQRLRP